MTTISLNTVVNWWLSKEALKGPKFSSNDSILTGSDLAHGRHSHQELHNEELAESQIS